MEPILASFGEEGEGLLSAHMMIEGTTDDPEGTAAFSLKDVSVKGFIAKKPTVLSAGRIVSSV